MTTDIELLNELESKGTLKRLVKMGCVSTAILMHREAYLEYDKQVRTTRKNKSDIVTHVSEAFGISESMMWRIVKRFRPNVK